MPSYIIITFWESYYNYRWLSYIKKRGKKEVPWPTALTRVSFSPYPFCCCCCSYLVWCHRKLNLRWKFSCCTCVYRRPPSQVGISVSSIVFIHNWMNFLWTDCLQLKNSSCCNYFQDLLPNLVATNHAGIIKSYWGMWEAHRCIWKVT